MTREEAAVKARAICIMAEDLGAKLIFPEYNKNKEESCPSFTLSDEAFMNIFGDGKYYTEEMAGEDGSESRGIEKHCKVDGIFFHAFALKEEGKKE